MKIGDMVRLAGEQPCIQQVWIIKNIKSDARGIWLQFDETPNDMWYSAKSYEILTSENKGEG